MAEFFDKIFDPAWDLSRAVSFFALKTGLKPLVGAEIEFYASASLDENLKKELVSYLQENGLNGAFEDERSERQYEFIFPPYADLAKLAADIFKFRELTAKFLDKKNFIALFSASPYEKMPGSGMHFHISLHNEKLENMFKKIGDADETEIMKYALAGLLFRIKDSLKVFAPEVEDLERYKKDKFAPKTISWGGNNRTVALRIPTSTKYPERRRIEHRVPCADADPALCLKVILAAIFEGMVEKKPLSHAKIFGDAGDAQYAPEFLV